MKKNKFLVLILMWQIISSSALLANNNFHHIKIVTSKTNLTNPNLQVSRKTFITRHSPKLNGEGKVEGSIRVLLAESFDINGNAKVIGDIYVPGSPEVYASSNANYEAKVIGDGNQYPSNYRIKLNGSSRIQRIITCTDAVSIEPVPSVVPPQGLRDIALVKGEHPGNFSTLRDLILTRKYNLTLEVPEGSYGNFRAHGRSGFIFGKDNEETTYNLQSLELNTNTQVQIRGKVTINIKNSLVLNSNSKMGNSAKIENLLVNIQSTGATLNSSTEFYGTINAPSGSLTLNSNSKLVGSIICDRLNLNSNSLLKHL
ncbi:MAG: hypothetical protein HY819_10150 [Acidobacteria bacterium]|nr:hypothetical protein [Acidobacteriota bacterium]